MGDSVVVLISGRKGAGKSTAGGMLVREHGFVEVALADALRAVVVETFNAWAPMMGWRLARPLTTDMCVDQATKETSLAKLVGVDGAADMYLQGQLATPRWLLQWFGTDVARKLIGEDVWLHAAVNAIVAGGHKRVVVTDVRFHTDAVALPTLLSDAGFARVVRLRIVNPHDAPLAADAHVSEREIETHPFDALIVNDKTKSTTTEFEAAVLHALTRVCGLEGLGPTKK